MVYYDLSVCAIFTYAFVSVGHACMIAAFFIRWPVVPSGEAGPVFFAEKAVYAFAHDEIDKHVELVVL